MKRFILIAVSTMTFFLATAQDKESYLFIGSYTSDGNTEGIHVYKFNSETGEPTRISATRISNANFLAISQDQKYVYAINEDSTDAGSIAAFSFDKKKGTLQFINKKSSGNHPCYVSVTNNNKWVVAGHYGGGTVGVLPVKADGSPR
ncbi:MAG: beta-propeller fold lactonase family protein [Chitinophagaceae bacterium]